jgi:dsRNA-specific ribonuclease
MQMDLIKAKVENVLSKFDLKPSNFITEALCVAEYEQERQKDSKGNYQLVEKSKPNQLLAFMGDRVLKLVLAEEGFKISPSANFVSKFTNSKENNKYLHGLKIISASDGYCMIGQIACENKKKDDGSIESIKMIATLTEAIIGAIYLDDPEKAREFIRRKIIHGNKEAN